MVNRPESVGTVAAALEGIVAVLGLEALEADGIQTAVAEACKNVVLHAYDGTEGPMEVELRTQRDGLEVIVVDHGIGIRPHLGERRQPHNGLGLPIIHLHAWRVTYTNLDGGGTELRMEFPGAPAGSADPAELACSVLSRLLGPLEGDADARVEVSIAAGKGVEELLAVVRERLGSGFSRVGVDLRDAADGVPEILALSLGPSG